jgi:hypothetical protein
VSASGSVRFEDSAGLRQTFATFPRPGQPGARSLMQDPGWYHALRRRSQRTRLNWTRMDRLDTRWIPTARILHPWPDDRFAATTQGRSEPSAPAPFSGLAVHAGICAGGSPRPQGGGLSLPRSSDQKEGPESETRCAIRRRSTRTSDGDTRSAAVWRERLRGRKSDERRESNTRQALQQMRRRHHGATPALVQNERSAGAVSRASTMVTLCRRPLLPA